MAQGDALMRALGQYRGRGVERGVRGKELQFQRSRAFGPGPIMPYPGGMRFPNLARQRPQNRLAGLRGSMRGY